MSFYLRSGWGVIVGFRYGSVDKKTFFQLLAIVASRALPALKSGHMFSFDDAGETKMSFHLRPA